MGDADVLVTGIIGIACTSISVRLVRSPYPQWALFIARAVEVKAKRVPLPQQKHQSQSTSTIYVSMASPRNEAMWTGTCPLKFTLLSGTDQINHTAGTDNIANSRQRRDFFAGICRYYAPDIGKPRRWPQN
jgi:hypothetical protein